MTPLSEETVNEIVASLFKRGEQGAMFRALATGKILPYPATAALRLRQKVKMHKVRKKLHRRGFVVLTIRTKGYLLELSRRPTP